MSIIRTQKKEHPFIQIDRRAIEDERLSFRARGIHTYLMSKPNGWNAYLKQLAKQSHKEGVAAVTAAMKELLKLGYATRTRNKDKDGKFRGWTTVVFEYPETPSPKCDFLSSEFLSSENRGYSLYPKGSLDLKEDNIRNTSLSMPQNNREENNSSKPRIPSEETSDTPGIVSKGREELREAEGDNLSTPNNLPSPKAEREIALKEKASSKGKATVKRHPKSLSPAAQQVLDYLNTATGSRYSTAGQIQPRLNQGATVDECTLVIDYLKATWSQDFQDKYLNQVTPFRFDNFDKNLNHARKWAEKRASRGPGVTISSGTSPRTTGDGQGFLSILNASIAERKTYGR